MLQVKNRAISTLASTQLIGDDHLHVAAGEGALFPTTFPFHITVGNEIESCTARTTDNLTTTRAQEGTSPAEHASGTSVHLNITAGIISELQGQSATINAYALNALNRPQETVAGIHYILTGTADQTILNTALTAMA